MAQLSYRRHRFPAKITRRPLAFEQGQQGADLRHGLRFPAVHIGPSGVFLRARVHLGARLDPDGTAEMGRIVRDYAIAAKGGIAIVAVRLISFFSGLRAFRSVRAV
jgi:hypothetical protein